MFQGQQFMCIDSPIGHDCGFSRRYAWIVDRCGVSWQIDLPHEGPSSTDG